nr:hypothetical protein [Bathymodiolus platifrons methanotrophic gill symbiont]
MIVGNRVILFFATEPLFSAICGFVQLQKLSFAEVINNCYSVQRNLFKDVIASFIGAFMPNMNHLNPEF